MSPFKILITFLHSRDPVADFTLNIYFTKEAIGCQMFLKIG